VIALGSRLWVLVVCQLFFGSLELALSGLFKLSASGLVGVRALRLLPACRLVAKSAL